MPLSKIEIADVVREVLREQEQRVIAANDQATLKVVSGILTAFGINEDDRLEIREDFAYLRRWRKTSEAVSRGGWIAVATILVSGMASAVWIGIKAILAIKGGMS